MLAGPLGNAAGQIDSLAGDLPTLIFEFEHRPDRARAHDAPLAFGDFGNRLRLAIRQRADSGDAERLADAIDIAAERAFHVIDIFGRREEIKVEAGAAL